MNRSSQEIQQDTQQKVATWVGRWLLPLQAVVIDIIEVLDPIMDEWYYRFDLWSEPPTYGEHGKKLTRGRADFSKVRSLYLYLAAIFVIVFINMYTLMRTTSGVPVIFDSASIGFLIGASLSERAFIAFAKAWSSHAVTPGEAAATIGARAVLAKVAPETRPPGQDDA